MPLGIELLARSSLPNRMRKGLWGGKTMNFRNKISEYGKRLRIMRKPNVVTANLYSEALNKVVRLPVTTSVLRRIDFLGGLDAYLLQTPDNRLWSDVGSQLKFEIGLVNQQQKYQEFMRQRAEVAQERHHRAIDLLQSTEQPAPETSNSSPDAKAQQ